MHSFRSGLVPLLGLLAACATPSAIEPVRVVSHCDVQYEVGLGAGPAVPGAAAARPAGDAGAGAADEANDTGGAAGAPVLDVSATLVSLRRDLAREVLGAPGSGLFGLVLDGPEFDRLLAQLDAGSLARQVPAGRMRVVRGQRGELSMRYSETFPAGWKLASAAIDQAGPRRDTAATTEVVTGQVDLGSDIRFGSRGAEDGGLEVDVGVGRSRLHPSFPVDVVTLPDGGELPLPVPLTLVERLSARGRLPAQGGGLVLGGLPIRDRDEWLVACVRVAPAASGPVDAAGR